MISETILNQQKYKISFLGWIYVILSLLFPCIYFYLGKIEYSRHFAHVDLGSAVYRSENNFLRASKYNSECLLCKFKPNNINASSTENDLILTIAFNSFEGSVAFVKTLRTTGSKANFVILSDSNTLSKIDRNIIVSLQNCGTHIVDIGTAGFFNVLQMQSMRYSCMKAFLTKFQNHFKRVILVDLYDTIFQGDPFTTDIDWSKLHLSSEDIPIGTNYLNKQWIDAIPNIDHEKFYDKMILNCGVIYGPPHLIIKCLEILLKQFSSRLFEQNQMDQGFFNKIVYNGELSAADIDYEINGLSSHMPSVALKLYMFNETTLGNIRHPSASSPHTLVHQIDRNSQMVEDVINKCPNDGLDIPVFIRIKYCKDLIKKYPRKIK